MPDELLKALEMTIAPRVDGLLSGDHRSTLLGRGTELAQVRPYVPGDDPRRIDWAVTARTREPHVQVELAERVLVTWLVLDTSESMAFGTAERRKADVALGVVLALGHAASVRGNRVGVVTFGGGEERVLPPTQGRAGLLGVMMTLREDDDGGAAATRPARDGAPPARRDRASARPRLRDLPTSAGRATGRRPLVEVAGRHDVLAVEIRDPREQVLATSGADAGRRRDGPAAAGRHAQRDVPQALRRAAAAERAGVARALAQAGVAPRRALDRG